MRILSKTGTGSGDALRMSVSVSENLYRVFFKTGEWNAIVRAALFAGGSYWVAKYLPLRFTNYAKSELGYAAKVTKRSRYQKGKMPLVVTGNLWETATSQSWTEARAKTGSASVTLHIATGLTPHKESKASTPYGNQPLVYRTLTTITEREIAAIAKKAEEEIIALVTGSTGSVSRKGTERRALTPTQRDSIGMKQPTKRTSTAKTKRAA